jgi:hypothetical protein
MAGAAGNRRSRRRIRPDGGLICYVAPSMTGRSLVSSLAACTAVLVACSGGSSSGSPADAAVADGDDAAATTGDAAPDASSGDADAGVDKSAPCVSTFGQAIGSVGFARFDGTVVAVLAPGNKTCTAPNSTHLVLELAFSGAVYRMVVDVSDTSATGTIHAHTITHAMIGGAWQDGWHTVPLDYVNDLGLKSSDFVSTPTADAVSAITAALDLGAHVSVFATAQGEVDSAHLVHRNLTSQDGAIVVGVDGASPTWLLFSFADQTF